ncbi:phage head closure protein [Peptacetobacter sp. AB845]|uniref:phage head closure protein n=1 Tax=Peptacetobacter sp. AB845 TaxID=3388429 RepID=UPI0039C9CD56
MAEKLEKMRHRIEIQKFTEVENELSSSLDKEWAFYDKCWASKVQLKASNTNLPAEKIGTEYVYRFKIRYRTDINEGMRIFYNNEYYSIKHINNIKETSLYETHLDCIKVKEGVWNE